MKRKSFVGIILVCLAFGSSLAVPLTRGSDGFQLRILHTNDMHARFDQTSALSTKCLPKDEEAGKCYGGFARLATLIRRARAGSVPALFLNAGDTYQGTTWFTIYKWEIVAKFLNLLKPDAISLGNHEFDDGPAGLAPFLNAATFPIVAANLDLSKEPLLAGTKKIQKSVVLDVAGHKVGVVGYLTPETKVIAQTGEVIFRDEVEAIREEVERLRAEGVKILIALGHSGFGVDKKIAAEVDGIDLVIGGHTNTFLWSGKQPDTEVPEGLYPTEVTQKSGRKAYVVQAYAYTKYIGNLTIDFNEDGEVRNIIGSPILVDNSIPRAKDILDELDTLRPRIQELQNKKVGSAKVLLDGDSKNCRRAECNFGNLIVDAMVEYNAKEYPGTDGWTDAAIAIHNSGSVRTSINREPDDTITMSDIISALPFNNGIGKIKITGKQLREVLEWSVYTLVLNDTSNLNGGFLHFSGLQVEYDLSKPSGSRVASVFARCSACRVPDFYKLNDDETYTIITIDFLQSGGDGYAMLKELPWTSSGITTDEVVAQYIENFSPVHPGVEWRISFLEQPAEVVVQNDNSNNSATKHCSISFVFLIPIILGIFSQNFY